MADARPAPSVLFRKLRRDNKRGPSQSSSMLRMLRASMQANDYACVEKNRRSPDRAQTALGRATQGFGIGRLVAPRLSANRSLVWDHSLQSSLLHVSVPVHSGSSQGGRDYDSDGFTTTTLRKRDQLKIGRSEWPTNPINKPGPVVISMGSTSMGHRRAVPGTHGRWRRTPPARGSACMASAHRSRRPDLSTSSDRGVRPQREDARLNFLSAVIQSIIPR
jgi:hypothetical protein